ncbi:hypothetical protein ILUMI_19851 [Ignelater luminosus]|uniref:Uncharacterized protein n=1 Tax=Ignelater luminosus TaxID=2038154 RepID=A0A8K0CJC3_IGNLU|nr:hypothetical protein ILUMI_19851 [Ignelater luminosus]
MHLRGDQPVQPVDRGLPHSAKKTSCPASVTPRVIISVNGPQFINQRWQTTRHFRREFTSRVLQTEMPSQHRHFSRVGPIIFRPAEDRRPDTTDTTFKEETRKGTASTNQYVQAHRQSLGASLLRFTRGDRVPPGITTPNSSYVNLTWDETTNRSVKKGKTEQEARNKEGRNQKGDTPENRLWI